MDPFVKRTLLNFLDCFLILFVLFPLTVLHWRGTWDLLDAYILPNDLFNSSWTTLLIGTNLCFLAYVVQPPIHRLLKKRGKWTYRIVSRIIMYIIGWAIMCFWRGLWNLLDIYLTPDWVNSLIAYAIAQILTLVSKTSRTNCGLPMAITVDTDPDLLIPPTRFNVDMKKKFWLYLADVIFTQFFTVSLNIIIWRGIWNIIDAFLFPSSELPSDLSSLGIGYLSVIILYAVQYPASILSQRLENKLILKVIFEDILYFFGTWATLFLWRGGWNLCVAYIIPGNVVGGWSCHVMGSVGLMLLQAFSNVGTNGTDLDGHYENGDGIYPLDYVRAFIEAYEKSMIFEDMENLVAKKESNLNRYKNISADSHGNNKKTKSKKQSTLASKQQSIDENSNDISKY